MERTHAGDIPARLVGSVPGAQSVANPLHIIAMR